jgi:hypothetical protein
MEVYLKSKRVLLKGGNLTPKKLVLLRDRGLTKIM